MEDDSVPAWKNTLKSSGVKPWDKELEREIEMQARQDDYEAQKYHQQQAQLAQQAQQAQQQPRSVDPQPPAPAPALAPPSPARATLSPDPAYQCQLSENSPVLPMPGNEPPPKEGPKVVHLQYNSPMGLYSSQNVEETLHGQTQAMVDQS